MASLLLGSSTVALRLIPRPARDEGPASAAPRGAPAAPEAYVAASIEVMSTPLQVLAPREWMPRAAKIVFATFNEVDALMSEWKPSSPLAAVNRAAGEAAVEVPSALQALIIRGVEIGELTDGAFDISWAALWGVWDFKAERPTVPRDEVLARRAALVDFRRVEIDRASGTIRLPEPGMKLGLGALAKGYALDESAKRLRAAGLQSFMISAGGQVLLGGSRAGRPWRVGVRDPRGAREDVFALLRLSNTSVSTSGDYERFFIRDGTRYHHVLDPRNGRPARGVRSATVICGDATRADALSTALMVLGLDAGVALARRLPGIEAVLVDDDGRLHRTPGLMGDDTPFVLLRPAARAPADSPTGTR